MDRAAIEAYVNRAWAELERLEADHRVAQHREHGAELTLAVSESLWEHVRALRPDFPTEEDRARDLEHHVRLRTLLDRAAHAVARR